MKHSRRGSCSIDHYGFSLASFFHCFKKKSPISGRYPRQLGCSIPGANTDNDAEATLMY